MTERMLVVGWPGADWAAIQGGAAAGRLPHMAALLARGFAVRLVALPPFAPATLWTTLATGWHADQHGVLSSSEPRPDGGGIQSAGRRSWQVPAFWEVLDAAGVRTCCAGWPATAPGMGWPGRHVDERFAQASGSDFATWAIPPDAVAPPALREELRPLRIHPADGLQAQVDALLPGASALDRRIDQRPLLLAAALAQTGTTHAVATAWAAGEWDMLCVCYDLLQLIGVGREPEDGLAVRVAGLLDMMLGRLLHLAGPGTTVLVVSTGNQRGQGGFLVAAGPGIVASTGIAARLIDVAPTILARFGLQTTMAGTAIPTLAGQGRALKDMSVIRPALASTTDTRLDDDYADTLDTDQAAALTALAAEYVFNQAQSLMARGQLQDTASVVHQLLRMVPDHGEGLRLSAQCAALRGDAEGCRDAAQAMLVSDPQSAWGHLAMAAWCVLTQDNEGAGGHIDRAAVLAPVDPDALLRLGGMQILLGRPAEACDTFRAAMADRPDTAEGQYGLGVALAALGDFSAAERALRISVAAQPLQPMVALQLGSVLLSQGQWEESVAVLRAALVQLPSLPGGVALLVAAQKGLAAQIAALALAAARLASR